MKCPQPVYFCMKVVYFKFKDIDIDNFTKNENEWILGQRIFFQHVFIR